MSLCFPTIYWFDFIAPSSWAVRFLPRAAEWAAHFFVIEDGDASPH
jgi:hypothetical protein